MLRFKKKQGKWIMAHGTRKMKRWKRGEYHMFRLGTPENRTAYLAHIESQRYAKMCTPT